jgi:hypothetical protein
MPLPISLGELAHFFWIYGIDSIDERDRLIYFIQGMDSAYREEMAKRTSDATATESKSAVVP